MTYQQSIFLYRTKKQIKIDFSRFKITATAFLPSRKRSLTDLGFIRAEYAEKILNNTLKIKYITKDALKIINNRRGLVNRTKYLADGKMYEVGK